MNLPIELYSPDQLSAIMLELFTYTGNLRDTMVRAKTAHRKGTPKAPEISAMLLGVLHLADVAADDLDKTEKLLKELEHIRAHAPVIRITLAGLPNRELKQQLTVWFREQIHPSALLTFSVRSDIGGGIVLQAGSHIYDFSFKKQLLGKKQRIGEIFTSLTKGAGA